VRWIIVALQVLAGAALIVVGTLGLSGEASRARMLSVAQASRSPLTRPQADVIDATLAERAWDHTALASQRDVLMAAALVAAERANRLHRTGPLDVANAAGNVATARLTALMADGPSQPLGWYLIAEHLLATAGFSIDVTGALRLSYVTGRFDVRAAERRIGLLLRYWPLLKDEFEPELKSDVRTLVFGQGYDLTNSRLAYIAYYEAPSQTQRLRQTLGEVKPDYLYWFDWETEQIKKGLAGKTK
jgi:hypothetical protein